MKFTAICAAAFALAAFAVHAAPERASAAEAEAMVHKAVAFIKANPQEKAFTEISNPKGQFVDRDLYIVVYRTDGTALAHGFNQKMIGKNLLDMRDGDGKEYWRERIEWSKTKTSFWQDLKFVDPLTHKMEPKSTYCELLRDMLVCGGVYKPHH